MSYVLLQAVPRRRVCSWCAAFFLVLLVVPQVQAQVLVPVVPRDTLYRADYNAGVFVPPTFDPGKQRAAAAAEIFVTFDDDYPQAARTAFRYAADIWERHITSPVPIYIEANWEPLSAEPGNTVLGQAGPTFIVYDFPDAIPDTWYPIALAEAILEENVNDVPTEPDITSTFNSTFDGWYFGTDGGVSPGQIDFVTIVLHEIGHGLGFTGSFIVDDGDDTNGDECPGVLVGDGYGCWGFQSGTSELMPYVFDRFVEDVNDIPLLDESVYPNPSEILGDVLESGGDRFNPDPGDVFFDGDVIRNVYEGVPVNLYAPSNFEAGSSYSHLDERSFNNTVNALMTPFIANDEAIHSPGPITCAIFQEMGWPLGEACATFVTRGLLAFNAAKEGDDVLLTWRLVEGADIEAIEVQQSYFLRDCLELEVRDDCFETVETVPVAGTNTQEFSVRLEDLAPGTYTFRLKQVTDEGEFFSEEIQVLIELRNDFLILGPYPNPTSGLAWLEIFVAETQPVTVAAYDVLGQRVAVLFNGQVTANQREVLLITADDWTDGVYFIQVSGEGFSRAPSLVVVD